MTQSVKFSEAVAYRCFYFGTPPTPYVMSARLSNPFQADDTFFGAECLEINISALFLLNSIKS